MCFRTCSYSPYIGDKIRTLESLFNNLGRHENINDEEPEETMILSTDIFLTLEIVSLSSSLCVGGDSWQHLSN